MKKTKKFFSKGFTLIELLVVIAILGVLAAGLLIAINPLEQLGRGRDSTRKTVAASLANSMTAYYTSQNATLPAANATWITSLVNAGELKSVPSSITYAAGSKNTTACATNNQVNYCYQIGSTTSDYMVFVRMESTSEWSKCTAAAGATNTGQWPYWIYSSKDSESGIVCMADDPSAAEISTGNFGTTAGGVYSP